MESEFEEQGFFISLKKQPAFIPLIGVVLIFGFGVLNVQKYPIQFFVGLTVFYLTSFFVIIKIAHKYKLGKEKMSWIDYIKTLLPQCILYVIGFYILDKTKGLMVVQKIFVFYGMFLWLLILLMLRKGYLNPINDE